MPHFWCGVMKFSTISLVAVRLVSMHRLRRSWCRPAGGSRRSPRRRRASTGGPGRTAGARSACARGSARARWYSRRCSRPFRLSMPHQVGDEMILRGCATTSRKRIFSSSLRHGEMRVVPAGDACPAPPRPSPPLRRWSRAPADRITSQASMSVSMLRHARWRPRP